jgi:hypothetical protein
LRSVSTSFIWGAGAGCSRTVGDGCGSTTVGGAKAGARASGAGTPLARGVVGEGVWNHL